MTFYVQRSLENFLYLRTYKNDEFKSIKSEISYQMEILNLKSKVIIVDRDENSIVQFALKVEHFRFRRNKVGTPLSYILYLFFSLKILQLFA